MTEALTPTEKSKKQRDNTKNATKNFDYTTIADRLRTVARNWKMFVEFIFTDQMVYKFAQG